MNQRPIKSGYLRQQLFLGMWKTNFYYLEGTQFLIFEDDKTHVPDEKIDLNGYFVDGVWPIDGYFSFILRNIQNECFFQLLSFTFDDASEWVSKLKQAILLSEYEHMFAYDNENNSGISRKIVVTESQDFEKNIPDAMKKQLEFYSKLNKDKWITIKSLKSMKVLQLQSQHHVVLKGEYAINGHLSKLAQIILQGEQYYDLFQPTTTNIFQDNLEIFRTKWNFKIQNTTKTIYTSYMRNIIQRQNYFILTKESILDQQNKDIPKNSIKLDKILDIIHLVKEDNKCICYYVQVLKIDKNRDILAKFAKEQIINFSILQTELEIILDLIVQNNNNNNNNIKGQQIQFTQSRIVTISDHFDTNSMNEDENCENIHFPPQDREGYVDRNLDKLHPAYIYRDRYDRTKNLNEDERKILDEFKLKAKEMRLNDNCLIRYLIARNYKIKDAYDMLMNGLQWRKNNNINSRKMKDYPKYQEEDVHFILGLTKWGHPILYTKACNANIWKFDKYPETYSVEGYEKFNQSFLEEGLKQMRGQLDQFLILIDCFKFTMKNFSFGIMKNQFIEVMNYYPERQYKILVINSDFVTRTCYKILKPFLPQRTVEKVTFVGSNQEEIKEVLLRDLNLDVIPKRYGGQNDLVI